MELLVVVGLGLGVLAGTRLADTGGEPVDEGDQAFRDLTNRGRGDHQDAEQREQYQQRDGDHGGHGAGQGQPADQTDEAAGTPHPAQPVTEIRQATSDVHHAERADRERRPADHHTAAAVGVGRRADQPPGGAQTEQGQHPGTGADEQLKRAGHEVADRPAGGEPHRGDGEDRTAEGGQTQPVPPVGRVDAQIARIAPGVPQHRAEQRRHRHP